MAKIVLTMNDMVLREITLSKERITIGRGPHNDLVIDSPAVSGEHAAIAKVGNDSILEDLNSTNGTQVNGQPVRKHFLQDNDMIELAQYRLKYVVDSEVGQQFDNENISGNAVCPGTRKVAAIRVLNGANAGKETSLNKGLTTIGRPGVHVAVITQRSDGFYLSHVEGRNCPVVNGTSIAAQGHRLSQGDIIDLVGTEIEFLSD